MSERASESWYQCHWWEWNLVKVSKLHNLARIIVALCPRLCGLLMFEGFVKLVNSDFCLHVIMVTDIHVHVHVLGSR